MKYIIWFLVLSLLLISLGILLPNTIVATVKAEEPKSLDTEIATLSKQYMVNEKKVRAIIKCESQMYGSAVNENKDKNGLVWSMDWGPMQINDYFHSDIMKGLGLDIHNQWDSLEYGFILINKEGYKPWGASKPCWSKLI